MGCFAQLFQTQGGWLLKLSAFRKLELQFYDAFINYYGQIAKITKWYNSLIWRCFSLWRTMAKLYKAVQQCLFMIAKQRQYKKFEKNLKEAITNVEKYCSAISDMKKDSAPKTSPLKGRLIRRQKVQTYNTVEDQGSAEINQPLKYATHTPKERKFKEQAEKNVRAGNRNKAIREFKMEQSFSNKYNTVKKEIGDNSTLAGGEFALSKQEISLKQTKKDKECFKPFREPLKQEINIEEEQPESVSGNGVLKLEKGWIYKGEYSEGLFHGYGELFHNNELIYSGNYEYGYFHGYGKLKNHPAFQYLIPMHSLSLKRGVFQGGVEWTAYFGEFWKGNVTGFGELWLETGAKVVAKWVRGRAKGRCNLMVQSCSEVE